MTREFYIAKGFALQEETQFKDIYFATDEKILLENWLPATEKMNNESFKASLLLYKRIAEKLKPKRVLVNSVNLNFVMSIEMQKWMADNIFTSYKDVGMKRKAFLVSEDFFTQLSLEQHLEEDKTKSFVSAFFSDFQKAYDWLMKE